METEERVKQIIRKWKREAERANKIHEDINLDDAKIPDLVLTYSLDCNWGWAYKPFFVIASRNPDLVRSANAVNECSFLRQAPYWAWNDESAWYGSSGGLPSELESAVVSFYQEKEIPKETKGEMLAHYGAIIKVVKYCARNETDSIPSL